MKEIYNNVIEYWTSWNPWSTYSTADGEITWTRLEADPTVFVINPTTGALEQDTASSTEVDQEIMDYSTIKARNDAVF